MSDRYAPLGRKFCKPCNCWYADNKASIESHERGATHLANVEKDLNKIRQNKQDLARAEQIYMSEMQRIEAKALKSLEDDAKRDPQYLDELDRVMKARAKANFGSSMK